MKKGLAGGLPKAAARRGGFKVGSAAAGFCCTLTLMMSGHYTG